MDGYTLNQIEAFENLGFDLNNIEMTEQDTENKQIESETETITTDDVSTDDAPSQAPQITIQLATDAEVAQAAGVQEPPAIPTMLTNEIEDIVTRLQSSPSRLYDWWEEYVRTVGFQLALRSTTYEQRLRIQAAADTVRRYREARIRGRQQEERKVSGVRASERERSLSPPRVPRGTVAPNAPRRRRPEISLERRFDVEGLVQPFAVSLDRLRDGLPTGGEEHALGWAKLKQVIRLVNHYMLMITFRVEAHVVIEEALRVVRLYNQAEVIALFRWLAGREDSMSRQLYEMHTFLKSFFVEHLMVMNRQFVANQNFVR
jgi:hypothetical protein